MVFCPQCGGNQVKRNGFCSEECELNWLRSQQKLNSKERRRLEILVTRSMETATSRKSPTFKRSRSELRAFKARVQSELKEG